MSAGPTTWRAGLSGTMPAQGARTTRGRQWVLLHTEHFADKRAAMSREWHLKRDRKFRKALAQTLKRKRAR